jgi:hypothetical protein
LQSWFPPALSDPAYLHVVVMATQGFLDNFLERKRSAESRRWEYTSFAKSIELVSKRLARNDARELLSDSNLMTVLLLSGYVAFSSYVSLTNILR